MYVANERKGTMVYEYAIMNIQFLLFSTQQKPLSDCLWTETALNRWQEDEREEEEEEEDGKNPAELIKCTIWSSGINAIDKEPHLRVNDESHQETYRDTRHLTVMWCGDDLRCCLRSVPAPYHDIVLPHLSVSNCMRSSFDCATCTDVFVCVFARAHLCSSLPDYKCKWPIFCVFNDWAAFYVAVSILYDFDLCKWLSTILINSFELPVYRRCYLFIKLSK